MATRFFVLPGITAHKCPTCADLAKRLRRSAPANSLFIPLSFEEQAQINMGVKIVKTVTCKGESNYGRHTVDVVCATIGQTYDLSVIEPDNE